MARHRGGIRVARGVADSIGARVDGNRAGVKGLIGIPGLRYSLSMERIYYAGDRFLTGTDIARALVAYAAALAQQGSAGAIEIPVRHEENGRPGVVNFLVGPASQLVTESVEAVGYDEIRDEGLVARCRA